MKRVTVDDLHEGMISNQTIYNERGTILVAQGVKLTTSIIKRLKIINIAFIDIKDEVDESGSSCSSLTETAQQAISKVKTLSESIFELKTVNVKRNIVAIEKLIQSVLGKPFIQDFLASCAHNEQLYTHSLRVAILSANMGLIKKYDEINLQYLVMSAILHDCGMGTEFVEDDEHAFLGFVKLQKNLDVDMIIALVCLQHHEHYNGGGFPLACSRTQISEFASLIAVVDYYDRLLMIKSDPRKALFDTIGQKNIRFDPAMINLFASTIDWSRMYNIQPNANGR